MKDPASDAAIEAIAKAIFSEGPSIVIEAYSAFGQDLRAFQSAEELCAYALARRNSTDGSVHVAVHYPDMAGKLTQSYISLDPLKCGGHTHRYRVDGWGLVWVYLQLRPQGLTSFISANSEKRAAAWAATYPELEPPSIWDWSAVARHLRRLRRALKLAA